METGFQFDVLFRDSDLLKVRVSAWNGAFGGASDVYVGIGALTEIANKLQGFPQSTSDAREVMWGTFGPETAGGGVSMRFYCIDGSGHAYVESKIESDQDAAGTVQSATFLVAIEASAIDCFVAELLKVDRGTATTASLRATAASL